jgi:hypothetical protein
MKLKMFRFYRRLSTALLEVHLQNLKASSGTDPLDALKISVITQVLIDRQRQ